MSDVEQLALSTYFGERDRRDGRLVADALLDLYGAQRVRSSVLWRGAEGFGLEHHLRTEDLLSLSEDLPMLAVAVDRRERIEALLAPVGELMARGLMTLARVRALDDDVSPRDGTIALTVELGRGQRVGGTPAHVAVCDLLHREGVAAATVLLGVDGTRAGLRTRARLLSRNVDVPTTVTAVGDAPRIAAVLPQLRTLLHDPLLTAAPVRICKRDGRLLARPDALPATDAGGLALWQKLTVYTRQSATHDGTPISTAIVRRLRSAGAAGASSLRGIWGFHGDHAPHGDRLWQLRRDVPVVTVCIDTPERIAAAFAVVDELTSEQGLVTSETVPALRAHTAQRVVGGLRLATHDV